MTRCAVCGRNRLIVRTMGDAYCLACLPTQQSQELTDAMIRRQSCTERQLRAFKTAQQQPDQPFQPRHSSTEKQQRWRSAPQSARPAPDVSQDGAEAPAGTE